MKKNIYNIVALLLIVVLATACKDNYHTINDPLGNPLDAPGMGCILKDGLPTDLGAHITDATANQQYKVTVGEPFNINAGAWQAIVYSNTTALGETKADIINILVASDGKVSQPEFSAGVTEFTIIRDQRTDIRITSFQPMTRQLAIPFRLPEVNSGQVNAVTLRIKNAVTAVDVSKGFGNPVSGDANHYIESAGTFTVPTELSGLADGMAVFRIPAAPYATNGFLTVELVIEITDVGVNHALPQIPDITTEFNGGQASSPYFTDIIEMYLTPGGIETEIKPWEKEPEIEIPGI